jgi:hypothetical protein
MFGLMACILKHYTGLQRVLQVRGITKVSDCAARKTVYFVNVQLQHVNTRIIIDIYYLLLVKINTTVVRVASIGNMWYVCLSC